MKNVKARIAAVVTLALATAIGAVALDLNGMSASAADPTSVSINGQTHTITGVNVRRTTDSLIQYTPAFGATTGTNQYGFEAAVVNDVITKTENSVGNMAIPAGGYVLSGHGTSRTWLLNNAHVGDTVVLDGSTSSPPPTSQPPANAKLPDLGMRTLRLFSIANVGGVKELKFPTVMPNIGKGPFEIHGTRSSSTSTSWNMTQTLFNTDGTKTTISTPGSTFYYAGDGHNHWHVKDLNSMDLFDASGRKLATGAKHGFCFEDNTSYRDWPSKHTNGAPGSPVYDSAQVCGVGNPSATSVLEGLSVGWGDTYPQTLPDQYIDITGIPDGTYKVVAVANASHWYTESNYSNNSASAQIRINGNTVTLLSANDGL